MPSKARTRRGNAALPAPPPSIEGLSWASAATEGRVEWYWPGAIPAGTVVLLEGRKATGKSTVAASIAAAVTGGPVPPGWTGPTNRRVIWVAAEDSWESIVVPRLRAARAWMERVARLDFRGADGRPRRLRLPDDIVILGDCLREADVGLLVLDPFVSLCSPALDVRVEQQARSYLDPLAELMDAIGCVSLMARHLRKGNGGDAREAGLGSVAVANAARSVLRCDEHPYEMGRHVLSVVAINAGVRMPTQIYRIVNGAGDQPVIEWDGCCTIDADTIAEGRGNAAERDEWSDADRLLCAAIGEGWTRVSELHKEAEDAGVSLRIIRRAKERLRIRSRRVNWGGSGYWEWGQPFGGWPPNLLGETMAMGGTRVGGPLWAPTPPENSENTEKPTKVPRRPRARVRPPRRPKLGGSNGTATTDATD